MTTEMSKSRKERLRECERALAEHMEEFVKVGLALKEIREDRLWDVDGFKSFKDYCKERWDIVDSRARQLIDASEIRLRLPAVPLGEGESVTACNAAWNESQMRQLGRLGSTSKAKAVAERVVKEVKEKKAKGEKVRLGAVVRKYVDKELGVKRTPPKKDEPAPSDKIAETIFRYTGELNGMAAVIEDAREEDLLVLCEQLPHVAKGFADALSRLAEVWQGARPTREPQRTILEVDAR